MEYSRARKIRIVFTLLLLFLFVYANLYVVRRIGRIGEELYLYDKLLVAYREGGGMRAVKNELDRTLTSDSMRHELATARKFQNELGSIKNPEGFLEQAVKERRDKVRRLRTFRVTAFALIMVLLLLRLWVNLYGKLDRA